MTTTASQPPAIAAKGLRKAYGDKTILDGIDLTVPAGTIFSLLGPNGAGKTTTVKILSTLIGGEAEELYVGGHDLATEPQAVRASIGVTGQFSAVDGLITGEENCSSWRTCTICPAVRAGVPSRTCWSVST